MMRQLKLPCLLLIQPAITLLILQDAATEPSERNEWIGALQEMVAAVVGVGLLYPIVVSFVADRLRNDARKMLAIFRPGVYVAAGLGAVVIFAESAILAAAVIVSGGEDGCFVAAAIALGGGLGLAILLQSSIGRRLNAIGQSYSVLLDLNEHPALRECLVRLCAGLEVGLPKNILAGTEPEFFATPEAIACWDGEVEGGVLYLPLPTCRLLNQSEFEARVAIGLMTLRSEIGDVRLELRERMAGAVAAADDVNTAKNDWNWFSLRTWHPVWVVVRLGFIALIRTCIVLGAEWFGFFVQAFQKAEAETAMAGYIQAARASAGLCGAQWYVAGLEKEATLSLCSQYRLVEEEKATHRLGEVLMRITTPVRFRPRRPSPWLNPLAAWNILRSRCDFFGLSMDWCHTLALDVQPEPSAVSLFSNLAALESRLELAERKQFLPEDRRTREKRKEASVLKI